MNNYIRRITVAGVVALTAAVFRQPDTGLRPRRLYNIRHPFICVEWRRRVGNVALYAGR